CEVSVESSASNPEDQEVTIRRRESTWKMKLLGPGLKAELQDARASRSYGRVEPCKVLEVQASKALETSFFRTPQAK
ncbi:MAG TPA: hypothetical protein VLE43_12220, partial [Candidatus Saccharimonadia bacterium]|nr:hypothetical protein [Candidatus Saccharimonadia bacterium]